MFRALSSAATGMSAQELRVSMISNNLANVSSAGYKKSRAEFQDLLYDKIRAPGAKTSDQTSAPIGIEVGQGVKVAGTLRDFSLGEFRQSSNALDMAIEGNGFFQIQLPNGETAYTRDGSFKLDSQGNLVTRDGYSLEPSMTMPAQAKHWNISKSGVVSAVQAGSHDSVEVGQIQLANFVNPAGLDALGGGVFARTEAAGDPVVGIPGMNGAGFVMSGFQEMSNVKVIEEMVDMIQAQRAYESNSRVIKTADEMLRTTASLK
jgi:flagellar basal-body rod protein FlgG